MDQRILVGTATEPLEFLLVLASDHRTGAAGLSPTVFLSKAGGAFATPVGAVTEVGQGWYKVAANATDVAAVGPLILSVDATGTSDPADVRYEVVPAQSTPPLAQGEATYPLTFLLIDSVDHLSGKTGLSPTVTISKAGGGFVAPAGAVSEIGRGWYKVAPSAVDSDTAGPLLLHATATGADPTDARFDVATPAPTPTTTPTGTPTGGVFGVWPFGTWPVSLPDLRASADRDFLAGLIHTVAFEWDENAVGDASGAHPGHPSSWQPVIGFGEVACRVVLKRAVPMAYGVHPGAIRMGRILFGQAIPADQRNSVLLAEPTFGPIRLYLIGPVIDAHGMGHHWYADVQDCPLTLGIG